MTSKFNCDLGQKIRAIRVLKGIKKEYMAEKLGDIEVRTYSKYESGESRISSENLTIIATIFEMTTEEILKFDGERFVHIQTFNNQKGNGIAVQTSPLAEAERAVWRERVEEKSEEIRALKEENRTFIKEIQVRDDKILFLENRIKAFEEKVEELA